MAFKKEMSLEYIVARRIRQRKRAMWKYLGEALMHSLKEGDSEKYNRVVSESEWLLEEGKVTGHEAASRILSEILH